VFVQGRSRPQDAWEGWLVFERQRDARRFSTPAETTQPDAPAVLYWASGLSAVYLEGALERAFVREHRAAIDRRGAAARRVTVLTQSSERAGLTEIERHVLALFQNFRLTRLLTERVLDSIAVRVARRHARGGGARAQAPSRAANEERKKTCSV